MSDPAEVLAACERFVAGAAKQPGLAPFLDEHVVAGELAPHKAVHVCRRAGFRAFEHHEPLIPYLREFGQWWRAQHPVPSPPSPST